MLINILKPNSHSRIIYKKIFLEPLKLQPNLRNNYVGRKYSTVKQKLKGWGLWKGIFTRFVPIGLCLIAIMEWRALRKHGSNFAHKWEIDVYCSLPLRSASRCWGWMAEKSIPASLRPYIFGLYVNVFGVNINEAQNEDLKSYCSLSELFVRELKGGIRPINFENSIVSPCDGTVLNFGRVVSNEIEQVKGVTYAVEDFLGEKKSSESSTFDYTSLLTNKNNKLYQCVIYLAPGDYHRFHSPSEWRPTHRKHIPGELLSVNPTIAKWVPGLFCMNERAVYFGQWEHGFFSFAAVGATNVGSIRVYFDKSLHTNRPKSSYQSKDKYLGTNLILKKGDPVGEFRMGSTIVLIFEAPAEFTFSLKIGQKLKVGEGIGCVSQVECFEKLENVNKNNLRHSAKA